MPIDNPGLTADLTTLFGDLSGNTAAEGAQAVADAIESNHTDGATGTADALGTTGADVDVGAGAPGIAGDVLTLVDATHATWQAPSAGGPADELDANGTTLTVDAIADDTYLKRVGTTVVGRTEAEVLSDIGGEAAGAAAAAEAAANGYTDTQVSALAAPEYITATTSANLDNERVATTTTSITIDISTPGQALFKRAALTGDVTASADSNSTAIANDAVTYAKMQNVSTTDRLLGRDASGAGDVEELTVGGGVEFTGSGGIQRSALSGDVTSAAGSGSVQVDQTRGLRETGGPTTLVMGVVADGALGQRVGSTFVGLSGTADGQVPRWDATSSAWVAGFVILAMTAGTHFDMPNAVTDNNPSETAAVNVVIA